MSTVNRMICPDYCLLLQDFQIKDRILLLTCKWSELPVYILSDKSQLLITNIICYVRCSCFMDVFPKRMNEFSAKQSWKVLFAPILCIVILKKKTLYWGVPQLSVRINLDKSYYFSVCGTSNAKKLRLFFFQYKNLQCVFNFLLL